MKKVSTLTVAGMSIMFLLVIMTGIFVLGVNIFMLISMFQALFAQSWTEALAWAAGAIALNMFGSAKLGASRA